MYKNVPSYPNTIKISVNNNNNMYSTIFTAITKNKN